MTTADVTLRTGQLVSYTYWPVYFIFGDPTVISQTPLPLSGVQYSKGVKVAGSLTATLQLADATVRAINPWALVIPRKTGIVVVRTVTDPATGATASKAMGMYIVWTAPADPSTGRMSITAHSVESLWARRLITGTQQVTVNITPGANYTWSFTEFSGIGITLVMQVGWYNGSTPIGTTVVNVTVGSGTNVITSTHTAPAGATGAQPSVYVTGLAVGNGYNMNNFYFGPASGSTNFISNSQIPGGLSAGWQALNNSNMQGYASGGPGGLSYLGTWASTGSSSLGTGVATANVLTQNAAVSQDVVWNNTDQQQIAADLLNPAKWSQIAPGASPWPGWITVEPPTVPTGVIIPQLSYPVNTQSSLLQAHQDRANIANGYEWFTDMRVLSGTDAYAANAYRMQFILGYPRVGANYSAGASVPTFNARQDGTGNVVAYQQAFDGSAVNNIYWGKGSGYSSTAVQALAVDSTQWSNGYLQTEGQYQNTDVGDQVTLQAYTNSQLVIDAETEQYITSLTVRGDLPPTLDTYQIGDDCIFTADDWIWPDYLDLHGNSTRLVNVLTRILGIVVTPPEGTTAETVQVIMNGGGLSSL